MLRSESPPPLPPGDALMKECKKEVPRPHAGDFAPLSTVVVGAVDRIARAYVSDGADEPDDFWPGMFAEEFWEHDYWADCFD